MKVNRCFNASYLNSVGPLIGIIKSNEAILQECKYRPPRGQEGYCFAATKALLYPGGIRYGERGIKTGDIIEICLDLKRMNICYKINGISYGIAFKNIDRCRYRLFATFYNCSGAKLELI